MCFDVAPTDPNHDGVSLTPVTYSETMVTQSEEMPTDASPQQIHLELKQLAANNNECNHRMATLISLVYGKRHWVEFAGSFKDYVETHLGLKLRTVQEMMKVQTACQTYQITAQQIADIGWSKIAVVAKQITEANRDQVLADLKKMGYSQLREKYKQASSPRASKKDAADKVASKEKDAQKLLITPPLARAIQLVKDLTELDDPQLIFEFMAEQFLALSMGKLVLNRIASMN